jgi:hypothetical protein
MYGYITCKRRGHATSDSIITIRHMGFNIEGLIEVDDDHDDRARPQTVNWDRLDAERIGFLPQRAKNRQESA